MLVRHCATAWNASRRYQGRSDVPLSEEGRAQARSLALALRRDSIDAVYSSDLVRAAETARMIAEPHGLEVRTDARMREFDFGAWEGLTWDEIVVRWPESGAFGSTTAKDYQPAGGEVFDDVCARVGSFLDDLRRRNELRVVVVTHAGALHGVLHVLGAASPEGPGNSLNVTFAQASITRIAMEEEHPRLMVLNDVSHLRSAH